MDNIKLLEHQLQVLRTEVNTMQKEINEVLGDVQTAMQGMTRMTQMALEVFDSRIRTLENNTNSPQVIPQNADTVHVGGKEI